MTISQSYTHPTQGWCPAYKDSREEYMVKLRTDQPQSSAWDLKGTVDGGQGSRIGKFYHSGRVMGKLLMDLLCDIINLHNFRYTASSA